MAGRKYMRKEDNLIFFPYVCLHAACLCMHTHMFACAWRASTSVCTCECHVMIRLSQATDKNWQGQYFYTKNSMQVPLASGPTQIYNKEKLYKARVGPVLLSNFTNNCDLEILILIECVQSSTITIQYSIN